jgi:hypothetical protein
MLIYLIFATWLLQAPLCKSKVPGLLQMNLVAYTSRSESRAQIVQSLSLWELVEIVLLKTNFQNEKAYIHCAILIKIYRGQKFCTFH